MNEIFLHDLRCARRKAGLTQNEVGHLSCGSASKYARIESGRRLPTHVEALSLSLVFGRSFESLHAGLMTEAKQPLSQQLSSLPAPMRTSVPLLNRQNTLNALAERLSYHLHTGYGS